MKRILLVVLVLIGLQTQAQQSNPAYFCCDSITYWTDQGQGLFIGLDTTNIVHNPDSIQVYWGVCTNGMCYSGQGMYAYFGQVMTIDTVKVCYDVIIYTSNVVEVCTHCDSLIFDQNSFSWIVLNTGNTTVIEELLVDRFNDDKIYDLTGRELNEVPTGVVYIRNRKLYIKQ